MKVQITRTARTAALAAVIALTLASTAYADLPSIISSFRISGTTPPYARGMYGGRSGVGAIFYEGPGRHSFRVFTSGGSLVATYPMPGGVTLGDADNPPEGYASNYFSVLDEGALNVKIYKTDGSYVGTFFAVAPETVGIGIGGHLAQHVYTITEDGIVYRYTPYGSFVSSYATGVKAADVAAAYGYKYMWGDYIYVGPGRDRDPIRVYETRFGCSLVGSFTMPGLTNAGAVVGGGTTTIFYWNFRRIGAEIWAYQTVAAALMEVHPASLGKVKALFK